MFLLHSCDTLGLTFRSGAWQRTLGMGVQAASSGPELFHQHTRTLCTLLPRACPLRSQPWPCCCIKRPQTGPALGAATAAAAPALLAVGLRASLARLAATLAASAPSHCRAAGFGTVGVVLRRMV